MIYILIYLVVFIVLYNIIKEKQGDNFDYFVVCVFWPLLLYYLSQLFYDKLRKN